MTGTPQYRLACVVACQTCGRHIRELGGPFNMPPLLQMSGWYSYVAHICSVEAGKIMKSYLLEQLFWCLGNVNGVMIMEGKEMIVHDME